MRGGRSTAGPSTAQPTPPPQPPSQATGAATTFGNDVAALAALAEGVALVDASGGARLRLAGPGAAALLHSQTTASFEGAGAGDVVQTVFVTPQARGRG